MKVCKFSGSTFDDIWDGGEPWTRQKKRDAVETAFTDTRKPSGVNDGDEVELYVHESDLERVNEGLEPDKDWNIEAENVVSSPFEDLSAEVEENRQRYEEFFRSRGYREVDMILEAANKIPSDPSHAVSDKRLEGTHNNVERKYGPWIKEELLENYNLKIGTHSELDLFSLTKNYKVKLRNP